MSDSTRIDVCGQLAIMVPEEPITVPGERPKREIRHRGLLLLGFLALDRDHPVSRDELVLALRGEETSGDHRAAINSLLSKPEPDGQLRAGGETFKRIDTARRWLRDLDEAREAGGWPGLREFVLAWRARRQAGSGAR